MLVLFLAIFSLPLGLTALVGVLIYLLITELATRRSTANASTRQSAQRSLVEAVLEYIQGMSVVKSFGMEADSARSINAAIDESDRRNLRLVTSVAPFIALQQLVVRAASALLLAETLWLHAQGAISLVHAVLFVVLSFMVFGSLESAGSQITMLQTLAASIDTANAALDTPVLDTSGRAITPASSDIAFEDVSFAYVAEDGSRRQILDHVRFTIPANSTTAIIGPSGSGKTTLCHLIARFWDVDSGRITIGGHDVRAFTLESLMANISMVFQNVYLFADTIENNIRFGVPTASRKDVVAAAKRACCHDFIMQLPDGYDTIIGEGGATLSGGERQRISIARALLKDASIIILDEATASVDPENEAELQQAIEALTRRKTVIMIAHRLNTVRHADQILVLNNAHIIQQGTHDDLIRQPGLYRDFVNARATANRWTLGEA